MSDDLSTPLLSVTNAGVGQVAPAPQSVGGLQRTCQQYQTLLNKTGFVFRQVIDTGAGISVIEAVPA